MPVYFLLGGCMRTNIMIGDYEGGKKLFIDFGWFKGMDACLLELKILNNLEEDYFSIFKIQIAKFIFEIGLWK
jgi:hypothetical protein